ncbi:glycosyltransferase [Streptomyces pathocidini]|uniref:Glycosyltransferase n=1 Tax=Streptomyces pathocidini TaxID=1650571 RepID=A0ABW7UXX6_9ACTN|nr:glycosyltransferase [Streptomyces pathocidini]
MSKTVKQKVLVVSDSTGRGLGGVPVFNWELTKGLAKHYDVTLFTVMPHQGKEKTQGKTLEELYDEAKVEISEQHGGVKVALVRNNANIENKYLKGLLWGAVESGKPEDYGLPSAGDNVFDVTIGHSRFSGPAAVRIGELWYPDTKKVWFLHTLPEEYDAIKGTPQEGIEHALLEAHWMPRADIVTGVGPVMTEEALILSRRLGLPKVPSVHDFTPGTELSDPVTPEEHDFFEVLLMGRADDKIKGADDAIRAIRLANAEAGDKKFRLKIRGVPSPEVKLTQDWANDIAGNDYSVVILAFTKDGNELINDIRSADTGIMDSHVEGFGLVFTEFSSHGIPALANERSGAAGFVLDPQRVPQEIGADCVVLDRGFAGIRPQLWKDALLKQRDHISERFEAARELRETFSRYSWENGAKVLVEVALATDPSVPKYTIQGPDGTVTEREISEIDSPPEDRIPLSSDSEMLDFTELTVARDLGDEKRATITQIEEQLKKSGNPEEREELQKRINETTKEWEERKVEENRDRENEMENDGEELGELGEK